MLTVLLNGCVNRANKLPFFDYGDDQAPTMLLYWSAVCTLFVFATGLTVYFLNYQELGMQCIAVAASVEATALVTSCARKIFCAQPHRIVPYVGPIPAPGAISVIYKEESLVSDVSCSTREGVIKYALRRERKSEPAQLDEYQDHRTGRRNGFSGPAGVRPTTIQVELTERAAQLPPSVGPAAGIPPVIHEEGETSFEVTRLGSAIAPSPGVITANPDALRERSVQSPPSVGPAADRPPVHHEREISATRLGSAFEPPSELTIPPHAAPDIATPVPELEPDKPSSKHGYEMGHGIIDSNTYIHATNIPVTANELRPMDQEDDRVVLGTLTVPAGLGPAAESPVSAALSP